MVSFNTRRHFVILHMRNIYNESIHRERDRVTAARARQEKKWMDNGQSVFFGAMKLLATDGGYSYMCK